MPTVVKAQSEEKRPVAGSMSPRALFADGSMLAHASVRDPASGVERTSLATYLVLERDGRLRKLVAQVPELPRTWVTVQREGGSGGAALPFVSGLMHRAAPDGSRVVFVSTAIEGRQAGTFQVTMVRATGETLYQRRYPFVREPIPKSVGDSVIDARVKEIQSRNPQLAAALRKEARIPPAYPPIAALLIGRDGTLWIRMRAAGKDARYLILDERGEPIGSAQVPRDVYLVQADRHHAWSVESDELDVQSVVRYRVEAS